MSYTSVLSDIKTILEGVTGTANVYDYPRYAADQSTQLSLFVTTAGILHTWWIERTSAPAEKVLGSQVFRRHNFELRGFYELNDADATEKTFQALVDTIMDAFDIKANVNLTSGANLVDAAELVEKLDVTFNVEGHSLCHMARVKIIVDEEVTQ